MTNLGQRLRVVRRAQGRTLKAVAQKAGFTEAYISQVERGQASPPLASLKRIADSYGVSLVELLTDDSADDHELVLRVKDRHRLVLRHGQVVKELLVRRQAGKRMEPLRVVVQPLAGSNGLYDHAGEEFGIVLAGVLELTVEGRAFKIRKGDTFYFASTRPHGFRNPSARSEAVVLWVITPPSF